MRKREHLTQINYSQASVYFRTLGDLIISGLEVSEALTIAADVVPRYTHELKRVGDYVALGQSLYQSFSQTKVTFGVSLTMILAQSEYDNRIGNVCLRCAEYSEIYTRVQSKVVQAMLYPVLCGIIVTCMSLGILLGVVPHIQEVLSAFPINIPVHTRLVMFVSDIVRHHYWWVIGVIFVTSVCVFSMRSYILKYMTVVLQKAPILKEIYRTIICIEYIPLLDLVVHNARLYVSSNQTYLMRSDVIPVHEHVLASLKNGMSVSEALKNTVLPISEPKYLSKIKVGERNGLLQKSLSDVRLLLVEYVVKKLDTLIRVIEPCALLVIALIVGGLAMSILTPLYSLTQVLRS